MNTSGVPWSTLYFKDNYPRLQKVKAAWDPKNIFSHTLGIEPRRPPADRHRVTAPDGHPRRTTPTPTRCAPASARHRSVVQRCAVVFIGSDAADVTHGRTPRRSLHAPSPATSSPAR
ncbi:BBE domain-containing protein [Streptomyces sp. FXJ1.4098]|nr:BBE domain-containing protein [Streptomyces sp. FXJ1.4098]